MLDEGRVFATLDDCAYAAPQSPSCAYIPVAYGNGEFLNTTGAQQARGAVLAARWGPARWCC